MALEERERDFEKALGRQLRADAASGLDCPDAETLAAYHERMLSTEEMASLKSHIAACPSCQEILATLEVTEAIPIEAKDSERVLADKAKGLLSSVHATPIFSTSARNAAPGAKSSSVRELSKPKLYLRWAVPAGAIAAGLLIWVAMNESWKTQKLATKQQPIEIAENQDLRQSAPAGRSNSKLSEAAPKPAEKTLSAENEGGKTTLGLPQKDKDLDSLTRSRTNANAGYAHGPAMMQNQVQNQMQNNGNLNQTQVYEYKAQGQQSAPRVVAPQTSAHGQAAAKTQVAAAAPSPPSPTTGSGAGAGNGAGGDRADRIGSVSETVEVTSEAPIVEDAKNASADAAAKLSPNLPLNGRSVQQLAKLEAGVSSDVEATARKEKLAAEAGRAQLKAKKADTGAAAGEMMSATLRDADEFRLSVLRTPSAKVFWVISKEGEVFRSEDGGKSSHKKEISAGFKAIAGSAPDTKICWILGDNGIAVRTADGGQHWMVMDLPTTAMFAAIAAQDSTKATISDASGKISYSTADGGATWNLAVR
jgi:hypothetical protein